jgi:hypothetical protein
MRRTRKSGLEGSTLGIEQLDFLEAVRSRNFFKQRLIHGTSGEEPVNQLCVIEKALADLLFQK